MKLFDYQDACIYGVVALCAAGIAIPLIVGASSGSRSQSAAPTTCVTVTLDGGAPVRICQKRAE